MSDKQCASLMISQPWSTCQTNASWADIRQYKSSSQTNVGFMTSWIKINDIKSPNGIQTSAGTHYKSNRQTNTRLMTSWVKMADKLCRRNFSDISSGQSFTCQFNLLLLLLPIPFLLFLFLPPPPNTPNATQTVVDLDNNGNLWSRQEEGEEEEGEVRMKWVGQRRQTASGFLALLWKDSQRQLQSWICPVCHVSGKVCWISSPII